MSYLVRGRKNWVHLRKSDENREKRRRREGLLGMEERMEEKMRENLSMEGKKK